MLTWQRRCCALRRGTRRFRSLSVAKNAIADASAPAGPAAVGAKAAGAMLAALLEAGGVLEELDVGSCRLGDDGMAPLTAALPRCHALRRLGMADSGVSATFAAGPLAHAVRAAPELRGDLSWRAAERRGLLREAQGVLDQREADSLLELF